MARNIERLLPLLQHTLHRSFILKLNLKFDLDCLKNVLYSYFS